MSSTGQAVGTIVGGVIGFLAGGPAWAARGAALGYSVMAPDPNQTTETNTYNFRTMQNTRSHEVPIPVAYGYNKMAGNVIYENIKNDGEVMELQVALSEGPIEAIEKVEADDIDITEDARIKLGNRDQNADSINDEGQGFPYTAYVSVELEASEDLSGSPTIKTVLKGRRVEVWDGYEWVEEYSQNPAYCLLDFISNERYGLGISKDNIDLESFKESGDYCDETIDGEPRFQLDYVIDYQKSCLDHIKDILATFRGFLVYSAGEFRLKIDRPETPVQVFDMDNIAEDSFSYSKTSRRERYNRIIVEYTDPEEDWDKVSGIYSIDEDIKERGVFEERVPLYGVNRKVQAEQIAQYRQEKSYFENTFCEFKVGIDSLHCEAGDVVLVNHDLPAWEDKLFRIVEMREEENDEMVLTCQEHNLTEGLYYTLGTSLDIDTCWGPLEEGQELEPWEDEYSDRIWAGYARLNDDIYKVTFNEEIDDFELEKEITFVPSGSRLPAIEFLENGHYELACQFTPAGDNDPEIWLFSYPYFGDNIRKIADGREPRMLYDFYGDIYLFYTNVEQTKVYYRCSDDDYETEYTVDEISGNGISLKGVYRYYTPYENHEEEAPNYYGYYIILYKEGDENQYLSTELIDTFPPQYIAEIDEKFSIEFGCTDTEWQNVAPREVEMEDEIVGPEFECTGTEWEEIPAREAEMSDEYSGPEFECAEIEWQQVKVYDVDIEEIIKPEFDCTGILWVDLTEE